jgi:hypothetical protein
MEIDDVRKLETLVDIEGAKQVASETRMYLSSSQGLIHAGELVSHLSAFEAIDDLIPYFGDYRLAYGDALYQLKNSVNLAFNGFYGQAFSLLRSVCELSLLQASLPHGYSVSDRALNILRSMLPPDTYLPSQDDANYVLSLGFAATQTPDREATSLKEWAVDGCRSPRFQKMLSLLLMSPAASEFDSKVHLSKRLLKIVSDLDPYVHIRGYLRSATGLSSGNMLRFSKKSLFKFRVRMKSTTQISIAILMIAFLPSSTKNPEAVAHFIDYGDLQLVLKVLPKKDSELLREIYYSLEDKPDMTK